MNEELNAEEPLVEVIQVRSPGQDIFNRGQQFRDVPIHVGHKADSDSYARSKDGVYLRKIQRQKKLKAGS